MHQNPGEGFIVVNTVVKGSLKTCFPYVDLNRRRFFIIQKISRNFRENISDIDIYQILIVVLSHRCSRKPIQVVGAEVSDGFAERFGRNVMALIDDNGSE